MQIPATGLHTLMARVCASGWESTGAGDAATGRQFKLTINE